MGKRSFFLVALIILTLSILSGCNQNDSTTETVPDNKTEKDVAAFDSVTFQTSDGLTLDGRLYGFGKNGIILSHMFPSDQSSWDELAQELTEKGFIVLTFDFRGYGDSGGVKEIAKIDIDQKAAIDFITESGVEKIFLIGASMGGTAALKNADQNRVAGVISMSAPRVFQNLSAEDEITKIQVPKLFLASVGDRSAVRDAEWFFDRASEPKELKIFEGSDHGSDLLMGDEEEAVKQSIFDFLENE